MLREVGAGAGRLWTKAATSTEVLEGHEGFKPRGELWSPKATDSLTAAVYDALRSGRSTATETAEGHFL
eukprot:2309794-Prymnesium_polylepis.1